MLSDILSITDGAFQSLVVKDQVLDTNQSSSSSDFSKTASSTNTVLQNEDAFDNSPATFSSSISSHSGIGVVASSRLKNVPNDGVKDDVVVVDNDYQIPLAQKIQPKTLLQGNVMIPSANPTFQIPEDNDVIAEKYITGDKQRLLREKLKAKKNLARKHKKIVNPTIVKHHFGGRKEEGKEEKKTSSCCKHVNSGEVASSTIAPFLQIQNALESKIASLVSTLQCADTAEKNYLRSKSQNESKETAMLEALNTVAESLKDLQLKHSYQPSAGNGTCKIRSPPENGVKEAPRLSNSKLHHTPPRTKKQHKPSVQQQLLQTPIPRRRPPEPFSNQSSNSSLESYKPSAPRISNKGYALLHEILRENETPVHHQKLQVETNQLPLPPSSRVLPATGKFPQNPNNERCQNENETQRNNIPSTNEKKALHREVDQLMRETSGLKKKLQEVNHDMENIMLYEGEGRGEGAEGVINKFDQNTRKDEEDNGIRLMEHSLSEECPLDKYLAYPRKTEFLKPEYKKNTEKITTSATTENNTISDRVTEVLRKTQEQRKLLDDNLNDIMRKHREINTFLDPPSNEREENTRRIKKAVDAEIKFIRHEIQTELKNGPKQTQPAVVPKKVLATKKTNANKTNNRIPLVERNRMKNTQHDHAIKKNALPRGQGTGKMKLRKPVKPVEKPKEPPPASSAAYDELIMRHLYGRQPQLPARRTLKHQSIHHTPSRHQNNTTHVTEHEPKKSPLKGEKQTPANKFYFHPQQGYQGYHLKENLPVTGDLFPIAKPLAEPSRDPSKRLPIYYHGNEKQSSKKPGKQLSTTVHHLATSNVAVVEIKHDDTDNSQTSSVKDQVRAKLRKRVKDKMKLNFQPLPNVDIDTSEASTLSSTRDHTINNEKNHNNQTKDEDNSYNFQDFVAVHDIEKERSTLQEKDDDSEEDATNDNLPVTTVHGSDNIHPRNNRPRVDDGPPFPPQHSQNKCNDLSSIKDLKVKSVLQERAQEWLEQELLAKIISQLEVQNPDPTLKEVADSASLSSVELDSESQNWIDNIIGLRGIQCFIDAGIPVDKDLIIDLIRHVVVEKLESLFGFPQPRGKERDVTLVCEGATTDQTETIRTPNRTPLSSPPVSSHVNLERLLTPEQSSMGSLMEQSFDRTEVEQEPVIEVSYPHAATPLASEMDGDKSSDNVYPGNNISTPLPSVSEKNMDEVSRKDEVATPDRTEVDGPSLVEQIDFVPSSPDVTLTPRELTPPPQTPPYRPPPVPSTSPSTPSSTLLTYSTSTAVGLSTVDAISDGEHLWPSQVASDGEEGNGSAGQPAGLLNPALFAVNSLDEFEDDLFSEDQEYGGINIKDLVKGLMRPSERPSNNKSDIIKSEGEISHDPLYSIGQAKTVDKASDDDRTTSQNGSLHEDTLDSVSLHQNDLEASRPQGVTGARPPILVQPMLVAEKPYDASFPQQQQQQQQQHRTFSTGISEGEALFDSDSKSVGTNESREHTDDDMLSIGQLQPVSNLNNVDSFTLSADNNEQEDVFEQPRQTPRHVMVQPTRDSEKSEGEVSLLQNAVSNGDVAKQQMVLFLPTADDEDENLSEYDLSTLSGGEL